MLIYESFKMKEDVKNKGREKNFMREESMPKLLTALRHYSMEQFTKDLVAGVIVAIIALPLSIALALASGVGPEEGIYTAIVGGFVIAMLGGSRVQISGPTAAFAVTIVIGQLKDFFGLTFQHSPIETVEKLQECISTFGTLMADEARSREWYMQLCLY